MALSATHLLSKKPNPIFRWCDILFGELSQGDGNYKLGKIFVKYVDVEPTNASEKLNSDFTNTDVVKRFPGLFTIRMQVEGLWGDSKNIVEFRTRRVI